MNSQLARYDHYSSIQYPGGTTPTTPTLTAALKSFEDLDSAMDIPMSQMEHQHQAKFMPPSVIPKVMVNMVAPPPPPQHTILPHEPLLNNNGHHQLQSMSLPLSVTNNSMMSTDQSMAGDSDDESQFSDDSTSQPAGNWTSSQQSSQLAIESGSQNSNDSQQTSFEADYSGENNSNSNSSSSNSKKQKAVKKTKSRGNTGRKPSSNAKLTPEEEQRRKVRRERNKLAAARCRKRRLDHTNDLIKQTEALEQEKQNLKAELENLEKRSKELASMLEEHQNSHLCKLNSGPPKSQPQPQQQHQQQLQQQQQHHQPPPPHCRPRPNTLPLNNIYSHVQPLNNPVTTSESSLVPIQTPSHGILLDNFLEGGTLHTGLTPLTGTGLTPLMGTGLTPLTGTGLTPLIGTGLTPLLNTPQGFMSTNNPSSCGGQQRSHGVDLSSPDKGAPPNLVSL